MRLYPGCEGYRISNSNVLLRQVYGQTLNSQVTQLMYEQIFAVSTTFREKSVRKQLHYGKLDRDQLSLIMSPRSFSFYNYLFWRTLNLKIHRKQNWKIVFHVPHLVGLSSKNILKNIFNGMTRTFIAWHFFFFYFDVVIGKKRSLLRNFLILFICFSPIFFLLLVIDR